MYKGHWLQKNRRPKIRDSPANNIGANTGCPVSLVSYSDLGNDILSQKHSITLIRHDMFINFGVIFNFTNIDVDWLI